MSKPTKTKGVATASTAREHPLTPASQALGQKRVLTSEQCYQKIRQAILEHRLAPGTRLVEERLVALSGISRTKIRPVLARLAHQKLVELIPNRGAFIASPSVEEAREVFFTRHLIEPAIVTLLCENAKGRDISKLKRHVSREAQARLDNDRVAIIRLSGEFHILLAELAGNAILVRMMHDLTAQTCLIITLYDRPNTPACQHHHHGDIIEAIEARDAQLAKRRLSAHLREVESTLRLEVDAEQEVDLSAIFA